LHSSTLPGGARLNHGSRPATDQEIQKWVGRWHVFIHKPGWITHRQDLRGVAEPASSGPADIEACPAEKQRAIKQAFRDFGISKRCGTQLPCSELARGRHSPEAKARRLTESAGTTCQPGHFAAH
jgi:hypothetical protein